MCRREFVSDDCNRGTAGKSRPLWLANFYFERNESKLYLTMAPKESEWNSLANCICFSVYLSARISFSRFLPETIYFTRIWFDASHSPVFSKADEWTVVERGGKTSGERARRENERETWVNNHNKKGSNVQRQPLRTKQGMWQHLIAPLRLLVAREKINTVEFHSLIWAHLLMHEWLANLYTHFMLLSTLYVVHYISLIYSYFTVLNVCFWIRNFLPLIDHFAWRNSTSFWHVFTLERTWINYADLSGTHNSNHTHFWPFHLFIYLLFFCLI